MRTREFVRARSERGAAAVEFALISLVLLTLLIGIIQASLWFWAYQVGAHAAREGARVAAVDPCDTGAIDARVQERAEGAAAGSAVDFPGITTVPADDPKVGDTVTVSIHFVPRQVAFFFDFPDINKAASARIENVPAGGC